MGAINRGGKRERGKEKEVRDVVKRTDVALRFSGDLNRRRHEQKREQIHSILLLEDKKKREEKRERRGGGRGGKRCVLYIAFITEYMLSMCLCLRNEGERKGERKSSYNAGANLGPAFVAFPLVIDKGDLTRLHLTDIHLKLELRKALHDARRWRLMKEEDENDRSMKRDDYKSILIVQSMRGRGEVRGEVRGRGEEGMKRRKGGGGGQKGGGKEKKEEEEESGGGGTFCAGRELV